MSPYINAFWLFSFWKDEFRDSDGDLQLSLFGAFSWAGLIFASLVSVCFPGRNIASSFVTRAQQCCLLCLRPTSSPQAAPPLTSLPHSNAASCSKPP